MGDEIECVFVVLYVVVVCGVIVVEVEFDVGVVDFVE